MKPAQFPFNSKIVTALRRVTHRRNHNPPNSNPTMTLKAKRKVAADVPPSGRAPRRKSSGGRRADRQLRKFFRNLGATVVEFIDGTPLGVPTPAPWSPSTDRKKALLSNPISALRSVGEGIDAASHSKFLNEALGGGSAFVMATSRMLMRLRAGLANAVLAEEALGAGAREEEVVDFESGVVTLEVPQPSGYAAVPSKEGCEAFVDLGADQGGKTSRSSILSEARALQRLTMKRFAALIDRLTLRTNGIVVTSDDCSVECSLDSLLEACSPSSSAPGSISCDEDDFEDCPSVVTELAMDDLAEDAKEDAEAEVVPTEVQVSEEEQALEEEAQEPKTALKELIKDEDEYVMAEEPDSEGEDFVEVSADFDIVCYP